MTDIDIVAELRRLYEMQDWKRWNRIKGPAEAIYLAVVMRDALPALLDAVDALRWYADAGNYHDPTDVPDHLYRDSGDVLLIRGGGGQRARAALAALKRSDKE